MIDDEVARLASDVVTQAHRAAGLLEAHKASAAKNAAIARSQAAKVRVERRVGRRDCLLLSWPT